MSWITFDLDGTLMQNPFVGHVFPELEETISKHLSLEDTVVNHLVSEHNRKMQLGQIVEAYNWDEIVEELLLKHELNIKINVEEIVIKHCVQPKIYLLDEHIQDTLHFLKEKGYKLAVATNGYYKYQAPVLKKLGIYDIFDLIITPEKVGYAKPDSRMLSKLMNRGEIVAHVGDRIDHDIMMANKVGMTSVFINRRLPDSISKKPIDERQSVDELKNFLQQKWHQETKRYDEPLPDEAIPSKIIKSIEELKNIL